VTTRSHDRARSAAALTLAAIGSACNVGPKYARPSAPIPPEFKEAALAAAAPPGTWQPARPADAAIKGKWWTMFHQPELDALEAQLNIDNQTIAQAFESFMAARAQVRQARASYYPTVTLGPAYNVSGVGNVSGRTRSGAGGATGTTTTIPTTQGGGESITSLFSLPLDVSWAPDLWGRVRNTVREFQYAAQVSAADLENERLTEQASLAEFYFQLRGQDALQEVLDRTVAADLHALELTRALVDTGIDNEEAVVQAEVTLQVAEATATGVAINRALFEHAIATLIGKPASTFALPVAPLSTPVPAIPVGIPSQLLQRRPDIAAAERTMAQANAIIGVAKSAYYPSLNLTGSGGLQSTALSTLFSVPALFWSLGAAASQIIFDGGLRGATVAQDVALYRADVAAYRQTVLTAFQQVEDNAATLRILSQQIARQAVAVQSAQKLLDLALARYQTGLDPYLNVVTAQQTLLTAQQTWVTLRVSEMTAAVQLVQALGGGWDVSQLPTAKQVTDKDTPKKLAPQPPSSSSLSR
jgi:NodT family efflux transporter outer membrane factor (OMF) lipoprotein